MALINGRVERVTEKNGIWALTVDNIRYGCYKTKPACKEGDFVEFEANQKGDYWNAKPETIKPKAAPKQEATSETPAKVGKSTAWVPDKDRQDSIIFQSSRKDALEFVNVLHAHGLIDLGKAKAGERVGILEAYLDKYTQRFFDDAKNLGHKEVKAVAGKVPSAVREDDDGSPEFVDDELPAF